MMSSRCTGGVGLGRDSSTTCGASHEAAERALTAGYQHVQVLPDGIAGWVKAGKKTTSI